MKFILYTDKYSPHELPLFLACGEVFDNAVYVVNREWTNEASRKGWSPDLKGRNTIILSNLSEGNRRAVFRRLLTPESVFMYGVRDNPYVEEIRASQGIVIYASERWLKPKVVPGIFHLSQPAFIAKIRNLAGLLRQRSKYYYFPEGVHAARDVARLCGLLQGDLRCLFRAPRLEFEHKPGGRIWLKGGGDGMKYCLDKMRMWGYFVEPSKFTGQNSRTENAEDNTKPQAQNSKLKTLRVLWVGRLLKLKRVDTLIRAVGKQMELNSKDDSLPQMSLDIYGEGPEKKRLVSLAASYGDVIRFHPFASMSEVRSIMRRHDVYVFPSNEYEGWGAVVCEALEEGMSVLCSRSAGAGATILPEECLFDCGDIDGLRKKILDVAPSGGIGEWSVRNAAIALQKFAKGIL